jgi:DNA-binding transcriptional LysR family regulator
MDSDDALLFVRLAETRSFKQAAAQLGITRSAASKRIAILERELGIKLVNRTSRGFTLSDAGAAMLDECRVICGAVERVHEALHRFGSGLAGTLQVVLPGPLAPLLVPPMLSEFAQSYPSLKLGIHLVEEGEMDVIGGGYDVAFVVSRRLDDSRLAARRLTTFDDVLVAAPAYLAKHGAPRDPEELRSHRCLGVGYASSKVGAWMPQEGVRMPAEFALASNCYAVLVNAACLGMGVLLVPRVYVEQALADERLQILLPEFMAGQTSGLFAVYPERSPPAKVAAIIEFVKGRFEPAGEVATRRRRYAQRR